MRWLVCAWLALAGCDRPSASSSPPAASARTTAAARGSTTAAVATASAPAAETPASPYQGRWGGDYESKRAAIELPKGYPSPAWQKDDGSRLGNGSVELRVDRDGFLAGEASGALGALELRGRIEDGALRAGATPAGDDAGAMTGTLTGEPREKAIRCTLRAASEDGEIVRIAEVTLRRK